MGRCYARAEALPEGLWEELKDKYRCVCVCLGGTGPSGFVCMCVCLNHTLGLAGGRTGHGPDCVRHTLVGAVKESRWRCVTAGWLGMGRRRSNSGFALL